MLSELSASGISLSPALTEATGCGRAAGTGHPHCGQTCAESSSSAPHSSQCLFSAAVTGHPQVGQTVAPAGISVPHSLQTADCSTFGQQVLRLPHFGQKHSFWSVSCSNTCWHEVHLNFILAVMIKLVKTESICAFRKSPKSLTVSLNHLKSGNAQILAAYSAV